MKCSTIYNVVEFEGITAVVKDTRGGIGADGRLVQISPEHLFPPPELHMATQRNFKPTVITEGVYFVILSAEIFQFTGKDKTRYDAVIYQEQENSQDLLLLWITDKQSVYEPDTIKSNGKTVVYEDTSRFDGFWQLLIRMSPGSSLVGKNTWYTFTIVWDGKDLNITKKSI